MAWFCASSAASILPLWRRISPRARKARARLGSLAITASISANALAVSPLPCSAPVIMASRRSLSVVAGLSISAVQISISLAGGASASAAQITGGSAATWALAAMDDRTVMANTALAATGKTNDRITGSQNMACHAENAASELGRRSVACGSKAGRPPRRCSAEKAARLMRLDRQQTVEPLAHRLLQIVVRAAEGRVAAGEKIVLLALQGAAGARAGARRIMDRLGIGGVDLAVEIGQFRAGADRLLHRALRGGAIKARLVVDRQQRAETLQLLRQRFVIAPRGGVVRVELDRGGEIGQRPRPVALPAPEFAAGVENIGQRRIEPQHGVVVADGAVDLLLALEGGPARDQGLDAVGARRLFAVDQRAANRDDVVGVIGRHRGVAGRGIGLRIRRRLAGRGEGVIGRRQCDSSDGGARQQDFKRSSHRLLLTHYQPSFRGASKASEPGIHNHDWGLWIPGPRGDASRNDGIAHTLQLIQTPARGAAWTARRPARRT